MKPTRYYLFLLSFSIFVLHCAVQKVSVQEPMIITDVEVAAELEKLWPQYHDALDTIDYPAQKSVLIKNATVFIGNDNVLSDGFVFLKNGKIEAVGKESDNHFSAEMIISAHGKYVTPGLIDTHSHIGVYPAPSAEAHNDGNEMTDPVTSEVWAEYGFWPQDPYFMRAVNGGVTTIQILPGSANLIGGRGFTIKLLPQRSARSMRVKGAADALKIACGENPKRVYGEKKTMPMTRMGNIAMQKQAFYDAIEYKNQWVSYANDKIKYEKSLLVSKNGNTDNKEKPIPPPRNLRLETLALVLEGKILVHNHCYRADEMLQMLQMAKEFGFHIRSFHHALEAYKIADVLEKENVAVSTWADWWGYKMEMFDGIPQSAGILQSQKVKVIIHSDSPIGAQRLNQEAAKAFYSAKRSGISLVETQPISWITSNPAWALGIDTITGTIETGKSADIVIWSHHPLSVYAQAEDVFINGYLAHSNSRQSDVQKTLGMPWSDFEHGWDFLQK